jgi:transposase
MSRMGSSKGGRRPRRQFTDEFMAGAVRLVLDEGKPVGAVARDLDLTPSSLANWVRHARADRTKGRTGLTTAEREELVGAIQWGFESLLPQTSLESVT